MLAEMIEVDEQVDPVVTDVKDLMGRQMLAFELEHELAGSFAFG